VFSVSLCLCGEGSKNYLTCLQLQG
jgi:hypothetical protein